MTRRTYKRYRSENNFWNVKYLVVVVVVVAVVVIVVAVITVVVLVVVVLVLISIKNVINTFKKILEVVVLNSSEQSFCFIILLFSKQRTMMCSNAASLARPFLQPATPRL
jgi:hypothetical protein